MVFGYNHNLLTNISICFLDHRHKRIIHISTRPIPLEQIQLKLFPFCKSVHTSAVIHERFVQIERISSMNEMIDS